MPTTDRPGAILVAGATSGAGKSTLTAALCRSLSRTGVPVAPFKAQNMSNHAAVTPDGGEVGRAQAMQAEAARADLDRRMNPILLKPTADDRSHLVVLGDERDTTDPDGFGATADDLKPLVLEALSSLRQEYRWVVAEGAGGAAEINLLDRDLVNLPLARAAGIPAVVVVDIERGGAFAAAHGTVDLLPAPLRSTVVGIVLNRFRGDAGLLSSGIAALERRTGVPVLGVLPWLGPGALLGVEDSLDLAASMSPAVGASGGRPGSTRPVRVAAIRLPHLANPSDLDPFAVEPDVLVRWVTRPGELAEADLIVLPGTRATIADLRWLRTQGLGDAIEDALGGSARVVGLCGGYQMLGEWIDDRVESGAGEVAGLGLLDVSTTFQRPKLVRRSQGVAGRDPIEGYQIRFGRPEANDAPWLELDGRCEGARSASGRVAGTSLHGLFDADGFRSAVLAEIAEARDRRYRPSDVGFAAALDGQHDHLADWVEEHLDLDRLLALGATATPQEQAPGW